MTERTQNLLLRTVCWGGALAIAVLLLLVPFMSGARAESKTWHVPYNVHEDKEACELGDFLCGHEKFHPIYQLLELLTGNSCCHNSEGRPTRDIKDLDPEIPEQMELLGRGFKYHVWVDGQWCLAKEDTLLRLKESQKEQFRRYKRINSDLYYSFYEYDHVFAPKSVVDTNTGRKICPTVYCI